MSSRIFGGMRIDKEFVDGLAQEWHENEEIMPSSLQKFIQANTGWTDDEYDSWALTGNLPE